MIDFLLGIVMDFIEAMIELFMSFLLVPFDILSDILNKLFS